MKLGTHIHNIKVESGIKYQPLLMQGYICNICRVVNKTQYKTTCMYQKKFDMWSSGVWSPLIEESRQI